MRNCACACCSTPSRSDCAMLTKMPASALNCRTLPCRRATKCPKLRMQQVRTTDCGDEGAGQARQGPQAPHPRPPPPRSRGRDSLGRPVER